MTIRSACSFRTRTKDLCHEIAERNLQRMGEQGRFVYVIGVNPEGQKTLDKGFSQLTCPSSRREPPGGSPHGRLPAFQSPHQRKAVAGIADTLKGPDCPGVNAGTPIGKTADERVEPSRGTSRGRTGGRRKRIEDASFEGVEGESVRV